MADREVPQWTETFAAVTDLCSGFSQQSSTLTCSRVHRSHSGVHYIGVHSERPLFRVRSGASDRMLPRTVVGNLIGLIHFLVVFGTSPLPPSPRLTPRSANTIPNRSSNVWLSVFRL